MLTENYSLIVRRVVLSRNYIRTNYISDCRTIDYRRDSANMYISSKDSKPKSELKLKIILFRMTVKPESIPDLDCLLLSVFLTRKFSLSIPVRSLHKVQMLKNAKAILKEKAHSFEIRSFKKLMDFFIILRGGWPTSSESKVLRETNSFLKNKVNSCRVNGNSVERRIKILRKHDADVPSISIYVYICIYTRVRTAACFRYVAFVVSEHVSNCIFLRTNSSALIP